ncbi:hypothetical protein [Sulfitobacter sp. PS-8MA]|uniref:hypothetical protein n=1 Tax=Sulfitobacter sp. PS-8MA TaxID=3237707 RepID=UPI0034C6BC44
MQVNSLIGGIWKGACHIDSSADGRHFNMLIRALIPVQASVFEMQDWAGHPVAMPDCIEPIPGFCLGDILAEELDADVPFGSLVVIRKRDNFQNISQAAGALVGEVLIGIIGRGLFPMMDEDSVLHTLGQAYHHAAEADELLRLGLEPAAFRAGLNAVLAQYWGRPVDSMAVFSADNAASQPSLQALTGGKAQLTLNQWTLALKALIKGNLSEPVREGQRGNVRIS